jgi:archaellum component FlaC
MDSMETIILAVIAGLFSNKGWEWINLIFKSRIEKKKEEKKDNNLYRDDLRRKAEKLENDLLELYRRREEDLLNFQSQIANLKAELATFRTKVDFLEKEIESLEKEIESLEIENSSLREELREYKNSK